TDEVERFDQSLHRSFTARQHIDAAVGQFADGRERLFRPWRVERDSIARRGPFQPIVRFTLTVSRYRNPKTHIASFAPRLPRNRGGGKFSTCSGVASARCP